MTDFLEHLIKHLVDKPDEVRVKEIAGEKTVVFEVSVGDGDMGKVIGKKGQTARSLRTILAAVAAKQGQRSVLEILDPLLSEQKHQQPKNSASTISTYKRAIESQPIDIRGWQEDGGSSR